MSLDAGVYRLASARFVLKTDNNRVCSSVRFVKVDCTGLGRLLISPIILQVELGLMTRLYDPTYRRRHRQLRQGFPLCQHHHDQYRKVLQGLDEHGTLNDDRYLRLTPDQGGVTDIDPFPKTLTPTF